jgi:hypothetical protein
MGERERHFDGPGGARIGVPEQQRGRLHDP